MVTILSRTRGLRKPRLLACIRLLKTFILSASWPWPALNRQIDFVYMAPALEPRASQTQRGLLAIFAGVFGAFLGLALLKFSNTPIMENWVSPPANAFEFVINCPWPIAWAYWLLAAVGGLGLLAARWNRNAPKWLLLGPLVWLLWQVLAALGSVDARLSVPTVKHFAACVLCFYMGVFSLSRVARLRLFWLGVLAGFFLVLTAGWLQHFGGLAETRRFVLDRLYLYHAGPSPPYADSEYLRRIANDPAAIRQLAESLGVEPDYLKKIASDRIFSTLFYPNALAGALLLLLPAVLCVVWQAHEVFTAPARGFLVAVMAIGALACLYWSGSKGGWLLMILLGLIAMLRAPIPKKLQIGLITLALVGGMAGFVWKYAAFFEKGATSVGARFDYWRAAAHIAARHPLFGTGPGTFFIPYLQIKRPESEPARLVHNDYLEQASDSGFPGAIVYAWFIAGALTWSWRRRLVPSRHAPGHLAGNNPDLPRPQPKRKTAVRMEERACVPPREDPSKTGEWMAFAVWLGVVSWSLQGFFEFGLYIPALSWPAFAMVGWLLGRNPSTQPGGLA